MAEPAQLSGIASHDGSFGKPQFSTSSSTCLQPLQRRPWLIGETSTWRCTGIGRESAQKRRASEPRKHRTRQACCSARSRRPAPNRQEGEPHVHFQARARGRHTRRPPTFTAAVPDWQAGDAIPLGAGRSLRVVEVREGVLVVESLPLGEPHLKTTFPPAPTGHRPLSDEHDHPVRA